MIKERFTLDFLEGQQFEGYTRGEDWNGFACPYFTFDQAQCIADAWRGSGKNASYDNNRDEFTFEMQDGEEDRFYSEEIEGVKLYPIGAGSWIWSESEK